MIASHREILLTAGKVALRLVI